MLWLLRDCFGLFPMNAFGFFWRVPAGGVRSKRNPAELEDEFVPVIGWRHSTRNGGIAIEPPHSSPPIEFQYFQMNGGSGYGSPSMMSLRSVGAGQIHSPGLNNGGSARYSPNRQSTPTITIVESSSSIRSYPASDMNTKPSNSPSESDETSSIVHAATTTMQTNNNNSFDERRTSWISASEVEGGSVPSVVGRLRVTMQHNKEAQTLNVTVNELAQLADEDVCAPGSYLQIRLTLLSAESKIQKSYTKFVSTTLSPTFAQTFVFALPQEQLAESVLRFRLFVRPRQKRQPFCAGEVFLRCFSCNQSIDDPQQKPINHFLTLKAVTDNAGERSMSLVPSILSTLNIGGSVKLTHSRGTASSSPLSARASRNSVSTDSPVTFLPSPSTPASRRGSTVDESGRFCSLPQVDGGTELLLSLCYYAERSKLVVGVQKASGLNYLHKGAHEQIQQQSLEGVVFMAQQTNGSASANGPKPPDSYVKVFCRSMDGTEIGKSKSEVVRANAEPIYNMNVAFNMSRNDVELSSVQVKLFTYQGIFRRKVLVGCVSVGEENCSSPDAQTHWREMIAGMGITVDKWHTLDAGSGKK